MPPELVPLLQLMQTKGLGPRSLGRIIDRARCEGLSLRDMVALGPNDIVGRFGLKADQAHSIHTNEDGAVEIAEELENKGVVAILRGADTYPQRLQKVLGEKAPPALFAFGSINFLCQRGVGFCGARNASEEALRSAAQVARALTKHGLIAVSGNAAGVDESAHQAALATGGKTALVLPEGILRFRHRPSIAEFLTDDNFVAVSEFPPNLPWSVSNAMQRNQTICALVSALIVIESGTSGGTWEAGLSALSLGIPLFVLDYPNPEPSGRGNQLLLKKGGKSLPCTPGQPADLTLLLEALDLPNPKLQSFQPSLFEH